MRLASLILSFGLSLAAWAQGDELGARYAGIGSISSGSLRDEDFNRGQSTSSDTASTVKGDSLSYVSVDGVTDLWRSAKAGQAFSPGRGT
jgi:hypothetical protein